MCQQIPLRVISQLAEISLAVGRDFACVLDKEALRVTRTIACGPAFFQPYGFGRRAFWLPGNIAAAGDLAAGHASFPVTLWG